MSWDWQNALMVKNEDLVDGAGEQGDRMTRGEEEKENGKRQLRHLWKMYQENAMREMKK